MSNLGKMGFLLEDEDIDRIATAVTEKFLQCPPALDAVLRDSYMWSLDITPMMDFSKEHPASNYRIDIVSTPTMFIMTFGRYGGERIGEFRFRREAGNAT